MGWSAGHSTFCDWPSEPCSVMCKAHKAADNYDRGYKDGRGSSSKSEIKSLRGKVGYWKAKAKRLEQKLKQKTGEVVK